MPPILPIINSFRRNELKCNDDNQHYPKRRLLSNHFGKTKAAAIRATKKKLSSILPSISADSNFEKSSDENDNPNETSYAMSLCTYSSSNRIDELPTVKEKFRLIGWKQWRPLKTSTLINFCANNDGDHNKSTSSKPNSPAAVPSSCDSEGNRIDYIPKIRKTRLSRIRPEDFNLPSALAKCLGIRGILYLHFSILDNTLVVLLRNGFFFSLGNAFCSSDGISFPSSVVRVEIRPNTNRCQRRRAKNTDAFNLFRAFRSRIVPRTNRPEFFEEFRFKISMQHIKNGAKVTLSAFLTTAGHESDFYYFPRELVGRMSFSLRKFFRMAYPSSLNNALYQESPINLDPLAMENFRPAGIDRGPITVTICEGGYFLLPDKTGLRTHLPQQNILHRKYYGEVGGGVFDLEHIETISNSPRSTHQ